MQHIIDRDPLELVVIAPWSIKIAKITQPNLDFMAPESQMSGQCNILSDMFSLGLVICALFNHGKQLIQANNNPMLYSRQIEFVSIPAFFVNIYLIVNPLPTQYRVPF
ncbi:jg281 [Pararge aegeria aegeria]|uniref:Jg281 protein n=1 Tax=Pararge aegeria aegeria TaxID=348720 RepID=A0A8S4QSU4_9NEOP|nr:jg281 [Pararge aegeria aegeria]